MPFLDNPLVVSLIMVLWGICVKYFPQLRNFPNRMLVWSNVVIGILAKLVAPEPAHAGFFQSLGHGLGWLVVPVQAVVARQVYETFLRPTLEHMGIVGYPGHEVTIPKSHKPH